MFVVFLVYYMHLLRFEVFLVVPHVVRQEPIPLSRFIVLPVVPHAARQVLAAPVACMLSQAALVAAAAALRAGVLDFCPDATNCFPTGRCRPHWRGRTPSTPRPPTTSRPRGRTLSPTPCCDNSLKSCGHACACLKHGRLTTPFYGTQAWKRGVSLGLNLGANSG